MGDEGIAGVLSLRGVKVNTNIYLDFIKAQRNISKSTYLTPVDFFSKIYFL